MFPTPAPIVEFPQEVNVAFNQAMAEIVYTLTSLGILVLIPIILTILIAVTLVPRLMRVRLYEQSLDDWGDPLDEWDG